MWMMDLEKGVQAIVQKKGKNFVLEKVVPYYGGIAFFTTSGKIYLYNHNTEEVREVN